MPNNEETTTKFKVDISELKSQFQQAQRTIRLANSEFKAATAGMDDWASSADGLKAKINQLDKVLDGEKSKLKSLESQYELVCKEQGENSKGADDLRIKINNQKAAVANTEKKLANYKTALEDVGKKNDDLKSKIENQQKELKNLKDEYANTATQQGKTSDKAKELKEKIEKLSGELKDDKKKFQDARTEADKFDTSLEDVGSESDNASQKTGTFQIALGNLVAQGITKAISGLKNLATQAGQTWKEVDEGQDNLIAKTGATGQQAEELSTAYKNVAGEVVGSFADMGSAAGEINTRMGFTGQKLTDATAAFMQYAKINGTDVTESVRLVSRAMGDAGIDAENYSSVLDILTSAGQKAGISVDTLSEYLAKYGAPMRQLGFDTEESIALFSQWEKSGVNVEIAFSGMKKAIGNWSKEGKDSKEEFKKTLDEIGKTPDLASATTRAIEVFGQKAGPDLADAIKGGRFEYEGMLDSLSNSKGTVKNTYGEMEDGMDRVKIAVQKAKIKVADFADKMIQTYGPKIEKGIGKFADKAEKWLQWLIDHKSGVKTAAKVIGTAIAGIFIVSKVSGFVTAIQNAITAVQGLKTAFSLLSLSNPLGWVGLAAGAVAGLYFALKDTNDEVGKADYSSLTKEQEKVRKKADEIKTAYQDWKTARDEVSKDTEAEFGYYDGLWNELQSIVDENGKIKQGYEDRANYIANQLESVTGQEIQINNGVIQNYRELKTELQEILKLKKGEAYLSGYEDVFNDAIKNQSDAYSTYTAYTKEYETAKEKLESIENLLDEAKAKEKQYAKTGGKGEGVDWKKQREILESNYQDQFFIYSDAKKEMEAARDAYTNFANTIQNYENLSTAVMSQDSKAVERETTKIKNNFLTAETAVKTGSEDMLKEQHESLKKQYAQAQIDFKNGTGGVTQAYLDELRDMVVYSDLELKKLPQLQKENAKEANRQGAQGVRSTKGEFINSVGETVSAADAKQQEIIPKSKENGKNATTAYAEGIRDKRDAPKRAAAETNAELDNTQKGSIPTATDNGRANATALGDGMDEKKLYLREKQIAINNEINSQQQSFVPTSRGNGESIAEELGNGMTSESSIWKIGQSTEQLMQAISNGLKNHSLQPVGTYIAQGLANSMYSDSAIFTGASSDLAQSGLNAMNKRLGIRSPSREAMKIGKYLVQGLSIGTNKDSAGFVNAVSSLASNAVSTLDNGLTFDASGKIAQQTDSVAGSMSNLFSQLNSTSGVEVKSKITSWSNSLTQMCKSFSSEAARSMDAFNLTPKIMLWGSQLRAMVQKFAADFMTVINNASMGVNQIVGTMRTAGLSADVSGMAYGYASSGTASRSTVTTNNNNNTKNVNYNYTQNNYSPTPLSRKDIYRQTKNLLNTKR